LICDLGVCAQFPPAIGALIPSFLNVMTSKMMWHAVAMSVFCSLVAPFGGFFASGFKRAFKIKVSVPAAHAGQTVLLTSAVAFRRTLATPSLGTVGLPTEWIARSLWALSRTCTTISLCRRGVWSTRSWSTCVVCPQRIWYVSSLERALGCFSPVLPPAMTWPAACAYAKLFEVLV
jgi:hypothetical protein